MTPAADISLDSIRDLLQYDDLYYNTKYDDLGAMAEAGRRFLCVTAPACRNILPVSVRKAVTSS